MTWQGVETAPKDGTRILMRYSDGEVCLARYRKSKRIENDEVVYEWEGWDTEHLSYNLFGKVREPCWWHAIPQFFEGGAA